MPFKNYLNMPQKQNHTTAIQEDHPSEAVDEENLQLSLDPKLQVYLAQVAQENGCWGRFFPIPFERAARKSWWDPMFDSEILEGQYRRSSNTYSRYKFRSVCVWRKKIWVTILGWLWKCKFDISMFFFLSASFIYFFFWKLTGVI